MGESQREQIEEEMIKATMQQSLSENKPRWVAAQEEQNIESELMESIMQQSMKEWHKKQEVSPQIQLLLDHGYSLDEAIHLHSIYGDNLHLLLASPHRQQFWKLYVFKIILN